MKQDNIIINVRTVINSPFCIDSADGQKIYELLHKALSEQKHVTLSFKGIILIITAFLNTAVGQLFKDFTEEQIDNYLSKTELKEQFEPVWEKVMKGAPIFYAHQEEIENDIKEILED
ncbi:MAG: STAS-like domain-containing protein [Proteiniphilum sp.]|nr:STAS-like domain-containing protein [Proteiniphilum sp.]MDD4416905.1 STAS-like domain-containing protein [Proteiniphilum sp.]